jgi:hypothetical protein
LAYLVTLLLLLAGGGRAILWNPEDRWLFMARERPAGRWSET